MERECKMKWQLGLHGGLLCVNNRQTKGPFRVDIGDVGAALVV